MAIVTHRVSKNSRYTDVLEYYSYKHKEDQKTGHYEPILDENGLLQERENYSIAYINAQGEEADPEFWATACARTNLLFGKNFEARARKIHEYIISHPEEDRAKMTMDDLMREGKEFAREHLLGYDVLIAVHRDTDNDHIHISINSVRAQPRAAKKWMMRDENGKILPCELEAGGKHQDGPQLRIQMNSWLLDYTREQGLVAKDNNAIAAARRAARHETKNREMKAALIDCAGRSRNIADLQCLMKDDYSMDLKVSSSGKTISVLYPGNQKYVRLRTLGLELADITRYFFPGECDIAEEEAQRQRMLEEKRLRDEQWKRYCEIRDCTWRIFIGAQRREIQEIQDYSRMNYGLYLRFSYADPKNDTRRMYHRDILEKYGYFKERTANKEAMEIHRGRLVIIRKYQAIAKARQEIVRRLILAGAEQETVNIAMKNYEEAMAGLRYYAADPEHHDFGGRRLRIAEWSLRQAQDRAERYIKQLEGSRLQPEQSVLMKIADREHDAFNRGEELVYDIEKSLTNEQRVVAIKNNTGEVQDSEDFEQKENLKLYEARC